MKLFNQNIRIGRLKYYFERWMGYFGRLQFIMVTYLFIIGSKISEWWIILFVSLSFAWMYLDIKFIAPGEMEASTKLNPEFQSLVRTVNEINRKLNDRDK